MRTNLNLSKYPFSNRRLFWIAVTVVFFVTLWTGLWINTEKSAVSARADDVSKQIKAQADNVAEIRKQQEEDKRKREESKVVLTEGQSYELLAARRLIAYKSLAWNRLIGDIEKYIPNDTRISSIAISEVLEGQSEVVAVLELRAIGKAVAQMTEMMTRLEQSEGLFSIEQAVQEQGDGSETPFVLNLTYRPSKGGA